MVEREPSGAPDDADLDVERLERTAGLALGKTEYADAAADIAERVRALCLRLPDVVENKAWAGTQWRVRKKTFAHVLGIDFPTGPVTVLVFRSSGAELTALRAGGLPFFRPKWPQDGVGMVIDPDVDWDEVTELVTDSYCLVAPAKLVRLVDRPSAPGDDDPD